MNARDSHLEHAAACRAVRPAAQPSAPPLPPGERRLSLALARGTAERSALPPSGSDSAHLELLLILSVLTTRLQTRT